MQYIARHSQKHLAENLFFRDTIKVLSKENPMNCKQIDINLLTAEAGGASIGIALGDILNANFPLTAFLGLIGVALIYIFKASIIRNRNSKDKHQHGCNHYFIKHSYNYDNITIQMVKNQKFRATRHNYNTIVNISNNIYNSCINKNNSQKHIITYRNK